MTVCLLCNHAPLTEHSLYADAASRSAGLEAELQTEVILYRLPHLRGHLYRMAGTPKGAIADNGAAL